jgi:FkbM family methyltransferase
MLKKSLCFDIGAHIGCWSTANIDKFDKIIAIEASPYIYDVLKNNASDKLTTINYAVCNNDLKDISFYHCHAYNGVLSTTNKDWLTNPKSRFYDQRDNYIEITCKTITIDKLIEQYGKPDFIKIDVECGEYDCISSLTTKIDILCFEWAAEYNEMSFKCLDYLENLGYTHFYIQEADDYTFRPLEEDYINDISIIKNLLSNKIHGTNWGMIWCK